MKETYEHTVELDNAIDLLELMIKSRRKKAGRWVANGTTTAREATRQIATLEHALHILRKVDKLDDVTELVDEAIFEPAEISVELET